MSVTTANQEHIYALRIIKNLLFDYFLEVFIDKTLLDVGPMCYYCCIGCIILLGGFGIYFRNFSRLD